MHSTEDVKPRGSPLGATPPTLTNSACVCTPPTAWVAEQFARLEVPLVGFVRRRLGGDIEGARDIVQEAFVKLCQQGWPEIEHHSIAWLYRTCRNRAIDLSRREGRMSVIHASFDVSSLHDHGDLPDAAAKQG